MNEPNLAAEKNPFHGTSCCQKRGWTESVWLWDQKKNTRTKIATVVCCQACSRPVGSVKIPHGSQLTAGEWGMMRHVHPAAPFYFTKDTDGKLIPEGWTPRLAKETGADRAAGG